jgi:AcrR family transcriptional regulator
MPRAFSRTEVATIRERLLDAGRRAVATTGLRRTTIGVLTRGAGISQGAFYLFFPSKEALLVEILEEAEREVRRRLDEVAKVGTMREVLGAIFDVILSHPLLRSLADTDEFAWLTRVLGPSFMDEARASDEAYFAGLGRRLRRRGLVARDVRPEAFASLARIALGVAQQREVLGADRFAVAVELLVEGLALRLAPKRDRRP